MSRVEDLKWDTAGLIPTVVQDASTEEVLTLAFMSRESLTKTRELDETVFFSRSRQELWHKGETSGHRQKVVGVLADCDKDALLLRVLPQGPACHTGARSCFFEKVEGFESARQSSLGAVLSELEHLIRDRKEHRPESSYTSKLFTGGRKGILQKVGEESIEMLLAGMSGDREEAIRETADLFFHVLVALRELNISLEDVARELQSRRK
jgi:phosphoribosyl-ATP pyrophosphohydrolase/phosphoribosyl-AMP cyclohydrolase